MKMTFFHRYLVAAAFVLLMLITAMRAEQPVYILDFSKEASLTTLFDAGLHPTKVSGSELSTCEIWNITLAIIGKGGLRVQIDAEHVEFTVSSDETLAEAVVIGRNLNTNDTFQEALRLFRPFGGPPPGLEEAFAKAHARRSYEPLRELGRGTDVNIEPEIGVGFAPGDFVPNAPQELHVRMMVSLYWKSNMARKKLRKEPIKPPAGYEQFSMEPVLSPSEVRRRRDMAAIAAAQTATPVPSTPVPTATPNATPPPTTPLAQTPVAPLDRRLPWWPWAIGIAALAVIVSLVWKRRS